MREHCWCPGLLRARCIGWVALDYHDGGFFGGDPLGQLLGVGDAQRGLVQPRVDAERRQLAQ